MQVCGWVRGGMSVPHIRTWTTGCDCAFCSEVSISFSFTSYTEAAETAVAVIAYNTYVHNYVRTYMYVPFNTFKYTARTYMHTHTAKALYRQLTHLVLVVRPFIRPRPLLFFFSAFLAVLSPAREPPVFILPGLPAASSGEASWTGRAINMHVCTYVHTHKCMYFHITHQCRQDCDIKITDLLILQCKCVRLEGGTHM